MKTLFDFEWLILPAALAWVETRDRVFAGGPSSADPENLLSALREYNIKRGKHPPSLEEIWVKLCLAIADGKIRAVGVALPRKELVDEKNLEDSDISPAEVRSLVVYQEHNLLYLFRDVDIKTLSLEKRRGYSAVYINGDDLVTEFLKKVNSSKDIGSPKSLKGEGFLPLSDAAYFIATEEANRIFDIEDSSVWKNTFDDLLSWIASGKIEAIGRDKDGRANVVPKHAFAGVPVSYPYFDPFERGPCLICYPVINDKLWHDGFCDSLYPKGYIGATPWAWRTCSDGKIRPDWTHIQLKKSDVLKLFQASTAETKAGLSEIEVPRRMKKKDGEIRSGVSIVLERAQESLNRDPKLTLNRLVKELLKMSVVSESFSSQTAIRQILQGSYQPMKVRGIKSPFEGKWSGNYDAETIVTIRNRFAHGPLDMGLNLETRTFEMYLRKVAVKGKLQFETNVLTKEELDKARNAVSTLYNDLLENWGAIVGVSWPDDLAPPHR
jgi:hypothetical protein